MTNKGSIDTLNMLEFFYYDKPYKLPEIEKQDREQVEANFQMLREELEVLKYLANMFDNNTLYRALPYDKAKIISDYIDEQNNFHPEIREILTRISNEEEW